VNSIKALFLTADPLGTSRLALAEEMRLINEKVYASEHREQIELTEAWAVRPDDLLQALNRYRPQIVHFSGHGSKTGELLLIGSEGFPRPISVQALKAVFKTLKDNIRLVVLNACYSKIQAEAIRQEIECVVGMNDAIGDEAAITFSASFYRALGFGRSIQEAFEQGQTALLLEGIPEEQTPELLARDGSDPSQIFLLQSNSSTTAYASSPTPPEFAPPSTQQGFKLFFSYAHKDKNFRDELEKHLAILKRQGLIQSWYDQDINAGGNQQQEVRSRLHAAHIILLLISPDFIASDDLYNGELARALVRHRLNEARVVPIILRDTEGWEQTEPGQLLALPRELRPLIAWKNRDAAYSSIAKDIRRVIDELKDASTKKEKG
jgi:hypothetical protein